MEDVVVEAEVVVVGDWLDDEEVVVEDEEEVAVMVVLLVKGSEVVVERTFDDVVEGAGEDLVELWVEFPPMHPAAKTIPRSRINTSTVNGAFFTFHHLDYLSRKSGRKSIKTCWINGPEIINPMNINELQGQEPKQFRQRLRKQGLNGGAAEI
ncbi:hypothetical protein [Thermococcus sp. Bubb.Bath]|uniref:hypothetical protein n=1 Tax=Thermococcus sp. Bubb.Bath TaxID=1638242 RepID=UPI003183F283